MEYTARAKQGLVMVITGNGKTKPPQRLVRP